MAKAFEATRNNLKVKFNDPFLDVGEDGVDFGLTAVVDGRQSIATLRHKIAEMLLTLHPEHAPPLLEEQQPASGDDDDNETDEELAAKALPIHLRKNERADMLKDEKKPVSSLGALNIISGPMWL